MFQAAPKADGERRRPQRREYGILVTRAYQQLLARKEARLEESFAERTGYNDSIARNEKCREVGAWATRSLLEKEHENH